MNRVPTIRVMAQHLLWRKGSCSPPFRLWYFLASLWSSDSAASPRHRMDNGDENTGTDQCHQKTAPEAKCGIGRDQVHDQPSHKGSDQSNDQIAQQTESATGHDDSC